MNYGSLFHKLNRKRLEVWACGRCYRDLDLEPMVCRGIFCGYLSKHVDALYDAFLAGLSYSNFEVVTGLDKAHNAGDQL